LRVAADDGLKHIAIQQFDLQLDGPRLALNGGIAGMNAAVAGPGSVLEVVGQVSLDNVPTSRLFEYWPLGSPTSNLTKTRRWVVANISQGRMEHAEANFNLALPLDNPSAVAVRRFEGSFKARDVSVSYFKPLPPVRGVNGTAHFTDKIFDVQMTGGGRFGFGDSAYKPFSFIGTISYYEDKRGIDDIEDAYVDGQADGVPDKAFAEFDQRFYDYNRSRHAYGGEFAFEPNDANRWYVRYYDTGYTELKSDQHLDISLFNDPTLFGPDSSNPNGFIDRGRRNRTGGALSSCAR
jgi:hypothetical protein